MRMGKYPSPYGRNTVAIDEQDIEVDEDLDQDHGGIEDAPGKEDEGDRHGERGKPIAKGAVDEGRKQRDSGEDHHGGVERGHFSRSPVFPRDPGAQASGRRRSFENPFRWSATTSMDSGPTTMETCRNGEGGVDG